MQEENEKLRKIIIALRSEVNILNQKINNLEFALLGDQEVYKALLDEYNHNEIIKEKNNDEDFIYLNERGKLKK